MDFHSLTRRELQALCKKNKIPANITNAGMADALKALDLVEGIEEFMQQSQSHSETAQSSIESVEGSEVTSPYVAPTAGRSTRRRNPLKEDIGAVTSMTSTRRTTRKTAVKASDESQVETTRRKVQMASACKKMDSQLKECVAEEEKKDVSMTPAPLGVTSRRRRVVESTVQKAYSTRRSVRLAEKNVEMPNDEKCEESEVFNKELFSKDDECQKVDVEEGQQELSGITGIDAIADMEESCESKENCQVVSTEEQDITVVPEEEGSISFVVEAQTEQEISDNIEFIDATANMEKSEVVSTEEQDIIIGESEMGVVPDEEGSISFVVEAQTEQEISDNIEFIDATANMEKFEVVSTEEQDIIIGESEMGVVPDQEGSISFVVEAQTEQEISDNTEFIDATANMVKFEVVSAEEQDKTIGESELDCTPEEEEEEEEEARISLSVEAQPDHELTDKLEFAGSEPVKEADVQNVLLESKEVEQQLQNEKEIRLEDVQDLDVALVKFTDLKLQEEDTKVAEADSDSTDPLVKSEPDEIETLLPEESKEEAADNALKNSEVIVEAAPNKSSAMVGISDNKENNTMFIMEERNKAGKDNGKSLNELSLRQLTKMFKEKLEITKKSGKEQAVVPRPALQIIE